VDIILDMNIPGFDPAALHQPAQWHDLMASADVPDDAVLRVACADRAVFVYRHKRNFQVYDSRCPHQNTDMQQLNLQGHTLTCAKHGWTFDVPSGACIKEGKSPLKRYESKLVKGRVLAYW